jgi:hypothetical protein
MARRSPGSKLAVRQRKQLDDDGLRWWWLLAHRRKVRSRGRGRQEHHGVAQTKRRAPSSSYMVRRRGFNRSSGAESAGNEVLDAPVTGEGRQQDRFHFMRGKREHSMAL